MMMLHISSREALVTGSLAHSQRTANQDTLPIPRMHMLLSYAFLSGARWICAYIYNMCTLNIIDRSLCIIKQCH